MTGRLFDYSRYPARLLLLAVLLCLPFLRMVLREGYGVFHLNVVLAAGLFFALALLLALVTRPPLLLGAVVAVLVMLMGTRAVQLNLITSGRVRWIAPALLALAALAILVLRTNFYKLLLVFAAGSFLVDVVRAGMGAPGHAPGPKGVNAAAAAPAGAAHVIHIIFDEMLGLGAYPADPVECQTARSDFERVLQTGKFRIFPFAFSNYDRTYDSVPSLLNNRLVRSPMEFFPTSHFVLRQNAYFENARRRGMEIRVYRGDFLDYAPTATTGRFPSEVWKGSDLNVIMDLSKTESERFKRLLNFYIRSDTFWTGLWTSIAPARFSLQEVFTNPTTLQGMLDHVIRDLSNATAGTLFFVHVAIPHYPYVFKADGSINAPEEWLGAVAQTVFSKAEHLQRYRRYCGQVSYTARQLSGFLERVQQTGSYDSTTIIVHSDHGSRLRLRPGAPGTPPIGVSVGAYDYNSAPEERDLLDRFAALLAIKKPGATAASTVNEEGSLLHFFRREFGWSAQPGEADINSVYLFKPGGAAAGIRITDIWNSGQPAAAMNLAVPGSLQLE